MAMICLISLGNGGGGRDLRWYGAADGAAYGSRGGTARCGAKPRDELGGLVLTVVEVARATRSEDPDGIAAVAGVEITKALVELGLEGAEPFDLPAGLFELGDVRVAHEAHGRGCGGLGLPLADDGLDVGQRKPELLQLADPPHAHQGLGAEKPVAPFGPRVGHEEAELLVQVDGADSLLGGLGEVADLEEIALASFALVARAAQARGRARSRGGLGRGNQREMTGGGGHERCAATGADVGERLLTRTLT